MKFVKLSLICLMLVLVTAPCVHGQGKKFFKLPFGRKTTNVDQRQSFELTKSSGPWLIMCTSFVGEEGRQQAHRLAAELRQKHNLKSYIYTHKFNFEQQAVQQAVPGWAEPTAGGTSNMRQSQMTTASQSDFEEIAVLVGDFPTVDDSRAQKTLKLIKKLQPETLAQFTGQEAADDSPLAGARFRASSDAFYGAQSGNSISDFIMRRNGKSDGAGGSPLRASFLLTNPLFPDEYFEAQKVDHYIIKLNKRYKNSLLDNPGLFTVKIATFSGATTYKVDEMLQNKANDNWRRNNGQGLAQSDLADAMKKAMILTAFLRKKGIEAYQFHDRHESYVCVGGYDWAVDDRGRGNPEISTEILKFKGESVSVPGKPGAQTTFKLPLKLIKAGISCDAQPLPVAVPKAPQKTASRFMSRFK